MLAQVFTWVATAIALTGTVLNCKKIRACFAMWIVANSLWFAWDVYCGLYNRAIMDAVQLALAVYGFNEWGKDEEAGGSLNQRSSTVSIESGGELG